MQLLIIGGTRFIGRELVEQAVERNHKVTVISLEEPPCLDKIEWIKLDRYNFYFLNLKLQNRNFDCVIDNIALRKNQVKHFLEAFADKFKRYVLTSTVNIYENQDIEPNNEILDSNFNTDISPDNDYRQYQINKRFAEKELREFVHPSLEKVIVRPAMVIGVNDAVPFDGLPRSMFFPVRAQDSNPLIIKNQNISLFQCVWVKDLVRALLLVAEHPDAAFNTYNVANDNIYCYESFVSNFISATKTNNELIFLNTEQSKDITHKINPFIEHYSTTNNIFDNKNIKSLGWISSSKEEIFQSLVVDKKRIDDLSLKQNQEHRNIEISIAEKFKNNFQGHPGYFQGAISKVGIGTYMGESDEDTNEKYKDAIKLSISLKMNLIDTAINYRDQNSEISVGQALKELFQQGVQRSDICVVTKGGYIPKDINYIALNTNEIKNRHSLRANYIRYSLNQSRKNLNLETIDYYLLHNPEILLKSATQREFYKILRETFAHLEHWVSQGKIVNYGLASWHGFLKKRSDRDFLDINRILECAELVGGNNHNFKAIELPLNVETHYAASRKNHLLNGQLISILDYAKKLELKVFTSNSIMYGKENDLIAQNLNFQSNFLLPQKSLLYTASFPQVTCAIVGMKKLKHVRAAAEVCKSKLLDPNIIDRITKQNIFTNTTNL